LAANAERNGYRETRPVTADELYRLEPCLGPGALGALAVPDEAIICPFTTPLAFATEAVMNGVELVLEAPVRSVVVGGRAAPGAPGVAGSSLKKPAVASGGGLRHAGEAHAATAVGGAKRPLGARLHAEPSADVRDGEPHVLVTPRGTYRARWVVNAAGLDAD